MNKRFGQNFLVSPDARKRIVDLMEIRPGESVWEIGPGIGALTREILSRGARLTAFEIDHGFIGILSELFGPTPGFSIVAGDFLKTWKAALAERGMPGLVCGNLPYNAANAFMADFADSGFFPERMVFTVQKEGAERMRARVDASNYSSFSVLCQSFYSIKAAFDVGSRCFWPVPDVTSTVIVLRPRTDAPLPRDRALYLSIVRSLFASRRKTVLNNLKATGRAPELVLEALSLCGIQPQARAETLSPEAISALADAFEKLEPAPIKAL
jgi:16S rRNA (adenine1518-N6/adenine1519-N6)-dimethyltransferase